MTQSPEVKALVAKMTNWQRNQWAKAGYLGSGWDRGETKDPGSVKDVERAAALQRPCSSA